jgi:hypothetical protein
MEEIPNNIEGSLNFNLYTVVMNGSHHMNNTTQFAIFVHGINMELDKVTSLDNLMPKESLRVQIQAYMREPRRCCKA